MKYDDETMKHKKHSKEHQVLISGRNNDLSAFREDLETVEVTVNRYENFRSKTPLHLWPAECPPIKRMNWN